MTDENNGVVSLSPQSGADAIGEQKHRGGLDSLLARIDGGRRQLTGESGFVPGLSKAVLERSLQAEQSDHLVYK